MALIGDGTLLQLDGEVTRQGALPFVTGGGFEHARGDRRVGGHEIGAVRVEILGVPCEKFWFDCLVVCHTPDSRRKP